MKEVLEKDQNNKIPENGNDNKEIDIEGSENISNKGEREQLIVKIAEVLSCGHPERISWIKENIESIREATKDGKHDTLVYPASGLDGLRTMFAYDVKHLITIDNDERLIGETEKLLDETGVKYRVKYNEKEKVKNVYLGTGKEERIITEYYRNAKEVDFKKILPNGKADIYHEYASMNSTRLREESYAVVEKDGYLCFNESGFFGEKADDNIPDVFYEIVGIKKMPITVRHPNQVYTSIQADTSVLKEGIILKKEKDVNIDIVRETDEIYSNLFFWKDNLSNIRKNGFRFVDDNITETNAENSISVMKNECLELIDKGCYNLEIYGVPKEKIEELHNKTYEIIAEELFKLQKEFKEFFDCYADIKRRLEEGIITSSEALKELGIKKGRYGVEVEGKFPMAKYLAIKNKSRDTEMKIAESFVKADFR